MKEGTPIHDDLILDGYQIGIASVASTRNYHGLEPVPKGPRTAVVLGTDDVTGAHAKLTASRVPGIIPPHTWLGRLTIAWVSDAGGNPVHVVQHL